MIFFERGGWMQGIESASCRDNGPCDEAPRLHGMSGTIGAACDSPAAVAARSCPVESELRIASMYTLQFRCVRVRALHSRA
jgi:hypothetical protein